MFYVGQRVECIRDSGDQYGREMVIQKGKIYTIASFVISNWGSEGVTLKEVSPPPGIIGWKVGLFRLVVERKTLIEIFKAMLTPKTDRVSS